MCFVVFLMQRCLPCGDLRARRWACAGVAVFLIVAACQPLNRARDLPAGALSGVVQQRQDGALTPVAFARLEVAPMQRVAVASERGAFRLNGLPAGALSLRAVADDNGDGRIDRGVQVNARMAAGGDGAVLATTVGTLTMASVLQARGVVQAVTDDDSSAFARVVAVRVGLDGVRAAEDTVVADATGAFRFEQLLSAASMEVVAVSADGARRSLPVQLQLPLVNEQNPQQVEVPSLVLQPPAPQRLLVQVIPDVDDARFTLTSSRAPQGQLVEAEQVDGQWVLNTDEDAGPFDVRVVSDAGVGAALGVFAGEQAWSVVLGPDVCALLPGRDCDGDGAPSLPFDVDGAPVVATWNACASTCTLFGDALLQLRCDQDGVTYDCDDDADGQPDITEPAGCVGTDFDGDGLCGAADAFPLCRDNEATEPACVNGPDVFTPPGPRLEFLVVPEAPLFIALPPGGEQEIAGAATGISYVPIVQAVLRESGYNLADEAFCSGGSTLRIAVPSDVTPRFLKCAYDVVVNGGVAGQRTITVAVNARIFVGTDGVLNNDATKYVGTQGPILLSRYLPHAPQDPIVVNGAFEGAEVWVDESVEWNIAEAVTLTSMVTVGGVIQINADPVRVTTSLRSTEVLVIQTDYLDLNAANVVVGSNNRLVLGAGCTWTGAVRGDGIVAIDGLVRVPDQETDANGNPTRAFQAGAPKVVPLDEEAFVALGVGAKLVVTERLEASIDDPGNADYAAEGYLALSGTWTATGINRLREVALLGDATMNVDIEVDQDASNNKPNFDLGSHRLTLERQIGPLPNCEGYAPVDVLRIVDDDNDQVVVGFDPCVITASGEIFLDKLTWNEDDLERRSHPFGGTITVVSGLRSFDDVAFPPRLNATILDARPGPPVDVQLTFVQPVAVLDPCNGTALAPRWRVPDGFPLADITNIQPPTLLPCQDFPTVLEADLSYSIRGQPFTSRWRIGRQPVNQTITMWGWTNRDSLGWSNGAPRAASGNHVVLLNEIGMGVSRGPDDNDYDDPVVLRGLEVLDRAAFVVPALGMAVDEPALIHGDVAVRGRLELRGPGSSFRPTSLDMSASSGDGIVLRNSTFIRIPPGMAPGGPTTTNIIVSAAAQDSTVITFDANSEKFLGDVVVNASRVSIDGIQASGLVINATGVNVTGGSVERITIDGPNNSLGVITGFSVGECDVINGATAPPNLQNANGLPVICNSP
jgi:hypothetical protein